jgi:competence protein ComEC
MKKSVEWREQGRRMRWLPAAIGWVAGTALQLRQPDLWDSPVYAALIALAVALWLLSGSRSVTPRWTAVLAGLTSMALAFGLCGARASLFARDAMLPELEGRDIAIVGVVAAMPQHNETGTRFRLLVEEAQAGGQAVPLPPRIQLSWYSAMRGDLAQAMDGAGSLPELRAGERWRLTVRLKAPHGNSNPHGFDYELWLWEQGLQATGYVRAGRNDAAPERLGQTWRHPVELARQHVRDAIFARVADRQQAGILAALVTGDQNAIERADWDVFRATGVAHLMSISGLHVTLFAWLAALAVQWLWRRSTRLCLWWPAPNAALLGGVALATAYALFSGWGVPAQRTIWMLATVGLLRLAGRQWPWTQVWLLACVVVLILDPWSLLQAGFWLSFVAVGVLFATDSSDAGEEPEGAFKRFSNGLWGKAREQIVITCALAPLTLLLFQQLSVVGLLANALAVPWVTLVVTPLALLGVAMPVLWAVAASAVALLAGYLQWLAALPFASISVAAPPLWLGVAGIAGGVLLVARLPMGMRLLGLPLMLPVLLWQTPRPTQGQFELLAVDVGQGNAVIVRTASHALVYDTGPRFSSDSDAGQRVLVPLLRALGERVDTVVLSHRDTDHTGGAAAVLAMQPQAVLLSSIEAQHPLQALRPATPCVAGQRWMWDGVAFEMLHPQVQDYAVASKPNAISCVLRISNGAQTALLAGDIEQPQEARLVAAGDASLRADVLLVPHHGSKTSSSAAFLQAVQPRVALVQAGYRNAFGHPAAPVLERYRERGIEVIDSVHCGAATWVSSNPGDVVCERERSRRYWRHVF